MEGKALCKTHVCVIFGGKSSEYYVSLVTARNVIANLDKSKYEILMLGITRSGEWLLYEGDPQHIGNGEWEHQHTYKAFIAPGAGEKAIIKYNGDTYEKLEVDVAYLATHGESVEDGSLQGLLELCGIPYTGSGVLSSALCMDKDISRTILRDAGIRTVDWITVYAHELSDITAVIERAEARFNYPMFVKPAARGSSVGAGRAANRAALREALWYAAGFGEKILVEQNVYAREIECGIVGNDVLDIVLGEAIPDDEFYSYAAKYEEGRAQCVIPANVREDTEQLIRDYAERAYRLMQCRGLCRIDFFIDKADGTVYLNELNTLPGCTDSSMFPMLWQRTGRTFGEVLDVVINCAL